MGYISRMVENLESLVAGSASVAETPQMSK